MAKKSLNEILQEFQVARGRLSKMNAAVHEVQVELDRIQAALTDAQVNQRSAMAAVRTLGQQLQEALPGYLAGATTERTVE